MEYQLIFSPSLEIAASDFVTAWNSETATLASAQAHLAPGTGELYSDSFLDATWLVMTDLGLSLGPTAFYNLIESFLIKQGRHNRIKITRRDQPGGSHILIIEEHE